MRLNYMLIGGFLIIALLVGVVGYTSITQSQKGLQESIGKNTILLATHILNDIDEAVYNRIEEFQAYSKDLELQEIIIESNKDFERLENIQDYINKKDQEWISKPKRTITPFMQELMNNKVAKELKDRLDFYEKEYGYEIIGEIFVTNKYGANIAQTGKTSDYYQADEEWWQIAQEDGLSVSDAEYDESAGIPSVSIGIRVDDENENFLGVIKIVVNIKEMFKIIEGVQTNLDYKSAEIKLFNKEGKVIHDASGEFKSLEDLSDEEFFKEMTGYKGYSIKTVEKEEAEEEKEFFCYARSKGYKDYKGLGWILMIEHGTNEVFAPVAELKNIIVGISLIVITLAILIGLFISKSISIPIKELTKDVDEISKGNFDVRLGQSRIDEVKTLTNSLNRILASMKLAILRTGVKKEDIGIGTKETLEAKEKAENALEDSMKRYRDLFENANDLIQSVDQTGRFAYVNKKWKQILGYSDNEIKNLSFRNIISKKHLPMCNKVFERIMKGEAINKIETEFVTKKGKRIIVEGNINSYSENNKKFTRGIFRDVTDRKKIEQILRENREKYKALFEGVKDAIFVAEPQTRRLVGCNKAAEKLTGYTRKKILSMNADQLHPKDAVKKSMDGFKEQAMGKMDIVNSEVLTKNKKRIPVAVSGTLVKTEDGAYMIGIFRVIGKKGSNY